MKPVIHSTKHYIQNSLATTVAGAVTATTIATSVAVQDKNSVAEVVEGATIKAVYVEDWVRTNDTSPGSFVYIIAKFPNGVNDPTAAEMAALHTWDNKKNVLYTTQALSNINTSQAIPMFKGWVKIPKGKQRMGLGDKLKTVFLAQALDQNVCGFKTYKEYT